MLSFLKAILSFSVIVRLQSVYFNRLLKNISCTIYICIWKFTNGGILRCIFFWSLKCTAFWDVSLHSVHSEVLPSLLFRVRHSLPPQSAHVELSCTGPHTGYSTALSARGEVAGAFHCTQRAFWWKMLPVLNKYLRRNTG